MLKVSFKSVRRKGELNKCIVLTEQPLQNKERKYISYTVLSTTSIKLLITKNLKQKNKTHVGKFF